MYSNYFKLIRFIKREHISWINLILENPDQKGFSKQWKWILANLAKCSLATGEN